MAKTAAFHDRPSVFVRISALFVAIAEVIAEARALRKKYSSSFEQ